MAVFRVEKTKDFTVMSNHHLRNVSLSLKAKGLLSLMLSLPDNWDYTTKGIIGTIRLRGWPISVKTGWIRSAAQSRNWKSRGILPGTGSVTRMAGWAILSTSSMRSLCFPMDMILFCHLNGKIQDR